MPRPRTDTIRFLKLTRSGGAFHAFAGGSFHADHPPPYSPEFRQQIIDLARAGRDPVSLSKEFEPTAETIRKWVAAAGHQEGSREKGDAQAAAGDGLSATERDELARLRRENRQLRVERDILSRAAAWFARETGAVPSGSSGS